MIKSMTGYGKGSLTQNLREYQIEIKSVNHRYLDISIRMPKQLTYLEEEIKKEISSKIKRAKLIATATVSNGTENLKSEIPDAKTASNSFRA